MEYSDEIDELLDDLLEDLAERLTVNSGYKFIVDEDKDMVKPLEATEFKARLLELGSTTIPSEHSPFFKNTIAEWKKANKIK